VAGVCHEDSGLEDCGVTGVVVVLRELPQGGGYRLEHARIQGRREVDDGQSCADLCQCRGLVGGRLGVAGESDVTGEEDLRRIAAEVLAVLMQDVALAGELLRCPALAEWSA
jgi:hypothetical protein